MGEEEQYGAIQQSSQVLFLTMIAERLPKSLPREAMALIEVSKLSTGTKYSGNSEQWTSYHKAFYHSDKTRTRPFSTVTVKKAEPFARPQYNAP